jgi:hypothetical protein
MMLAVARRSSDLAEDIRGTRFVRYSRIVTSWRRWDQIDLKVGLVHVNRLKNGVASTHPIRGTELRALRALRKEYPHSPYLFVTERKDPMTPATMRKLSARAGELAKLPSRFIRTCCAIRPERRAVPHEAGNVLT